MLIRLGVLSLTCLSAALLVATADGNPYARQRQVQQYQQRAQVYHAPRVVYQRERVVYQQAYQAPQQYQASYYYSVGDAYQAALLADALAYRILAAQKPTLAQQPQSYAPRYSDPAAAVPNAPKAIPKASQQQGQKSYGAVPEGLAEVVQANCLSCHAGGKNGVNLDNLEAVPREVRLEAFTAVNEGEMPQGKKPLPDEVAQLFRAWWKASVKPSAKK